MLCISAGCASLASAAAHAGSGPALGAVHYRWVCVARECSCTCARPRRSGSRGRQVSATWPEGALSRPLCQRLAFPWPAGGWTGCAGWLGAENRRAGCACNKGRAAVRRPGRAAVLRRPGLSIVRAAVRRTCWLLCAKAVLQSFSWRRCRHGAGRADLGIPMSRCRRCLCEAPPDLEVWAWRPSEPAERCERRGRGPWALAPEEGRCQQPGRREL